MEWAYAQEGALLLNYVYVCVVSLDPYRVSGRRVAVAAGARGRGVDPLG